MTINITESILHETESTQKIWGVALHPLGCPACKQAFLVQLEPKKQRCPHCAQEILTAQSVRLRTEPPEAVVPYKIQKSALKAVLGQFVADVWLRPDDFTTENLVQRLTPVFLPMWMVDCQMYGFWEAETGFEYEVKSSKEAYQNGSWITIPVVEKRIRWEKRMGELSRKYNNVTTPAISQHSEVVEKIGVFDLSYIRPYHFQIIENIFLNVPDQTPEVAWPFARSNLDRAAEQECMKAAGAQHIRGFNIHAQYDSLNWTQLLLPVYFTHYRDDEGIQYPVYIHGQTGRIAGPQIASPKKGWRWAGLAIAVAVLLFLTSLFFFAFNTVIPGLFIAGVVFAVLAFGSGVFSLIPLIWPWQWNRKQKERRIYQQTLNS